MVRGEIARGVGIPFVDYARGDGDVIGEHHERTWSAVLIDEATPWIRGYRGLWGLDTRDRFGGERAPAGPRYERGGTVRRSWSDPLGWAGLQKVSPTPRESAELLRDRVNEITAALDTLDADIASQRVDLRRLVAEAASIGDRAGLEPLAADRHARIARAERELLDAVSGRTSLAAERSAHLDTLDQPAPVDAPQAHIIHKAVPFGADQDERARLLRVWSTVSAPLLFLAAAFVLVDSRVGMVVGAAMFAVVFLAIETIARKQFSLFAVSLVGVVVAVLVATAAVQGVLGQWRLVVAALLAAFAGAILIANLRDLRRG